MVPAVFVALAPAADVAPPLSPLGSERVEVGGLLQFNKSALVRMLLQTRPIRDFMIQTPGCVDAPMSTRAGLVQLGAVCS